MNKKASNFSRHATILIQRTRLECLTAEGIEPDELRAMKLLGRRDMDLDDAASLMLRHFRRKDARSWKAAYSAALLLMPSETFSDFSILDAVFSRLGNRLADRLLGEAKMNAVDESGVSEGIAASGAAVISRIAEELSKYREDVEYRPESSRYSIGGVDWKTVHRIQLGPNDGVSDEHAVYLAAVFSGLERRVLEKYFAKRFPPLGAIGTFSSMAADIFSRYGRPDSEADMRRAIEAAESCFDFCLSQIDPAN